MPTRVIIIGGGGHAQALEDALSLLGGFEIVGFTDLKPCPKMQSFYLGSDDIIAAQYSPQEVALVNAIGSSSTPPQHREKIYKQFKKLGYRFQSVIHPSVIVSKGATLGEGVQLMPGAIVNVDTVIGDNTLINTKASIDHGCCISAHCHIAPGVTVSGDVTIGVGCHIGTGAVIRNGITIGDSTLIGAGAVVVKNMPPGVIAFGVPAKIYSPLSVLHETGSQP